MELSWHRQVPEAPTGGTQSLLSGACRGIRGQMGERRGDSGVGGGCRVEPAEWASLGGRGKSWEVGASAKAEGCRCVGGTGWLRGGGHGRTPAQAVLGGHG